MVAAILLVIGTIVSPMGVIPFATSSLITKNDSPPYSIGVPSNGAVANARG
jgi:hypothetical protein